MPNLTEAPDLVVFDVTGTIITNTEAVADAFTAALMTNGIQITAEELVFDSNMICAGFFRGN